MSEAQGFVNRLFSGPCDFKGSAPSLDAIPPADYPEVAFIGRSNVGKSSLINALVNRHNLARTSETPGRTQMLNFFLLSEAVMLVDLPGYGYAKAPRDMVAEWNRLIRDYLRGRPSLRRIFVLIDSRRGLMKPDTEMMDLLDDAAAPYQLVLTKTDKLSTPALSRLADATRQAVASRPAAHPELLATSAHKYQGLEEIRNEIAAFVHKGQLLSEQAGARADGSIAWVEELQHDRKKLKDKYGVMDDSAPGIRSERDERG